MSLKKALGLFSNFYLNQTVDQEDKIVHISGQDGADFMCSSPSSFLILRVPPTGLAEGNLNLEQLSAVGKTIGDSQGQQEGDHFYFEKLKLKLDYVDNPADFERHAHTLLDVQKDLEVEKEGSLDLTGFNRLIKTILTMVEAESSAFSGVIFKPYEVFAYNSLLMFRQAINFDFDCVLSYKQIKLLSSFLSYLVLDGTRHSGYFRVYKHEGMFYLEQGANLLAFPLNPERQVGCEAMRDSFARHNQGTAIQFDKIKFQKALSSFTSLGSKVTGNLLLLDFDKVSQTSYVKSESDKLVLDNLDLGNLGWRMAVNFKVLEPVLACIKEDCYSAKAVWLPEEENMAQSIHLYDSFFGREIVFCCVIAGGLFNV